MAHLHRGSGRIPPIFGGVDDLLRAVCVAAKGFGGELCQAVNPFEDGFGCHDGSHSLDLATRRLALGEFPNSCPEILAWMADNSGVCDCTINTTARHRVVEPSSDTW